MIERWNRDQVLALAPDAPSRKAAQGVSSPGKWSGAGVTADALWGECAGSGATPYRACVDLSGPAYRCGCPSRKFPCKHVLGLLLLWSADGVPAVAEPAAWVTEWLDRRRARGAAPVPGPAPAHAATPVHGPASARAAVPVPGAAQAAEPGTGPDPRRAAQRERRVAAGLAELESRLADQVRQGLAGARHDHWDDLAKRLIDAQAPAVAGAVSRLGAVLAADDWPGRLLGEYALLYLLAVAYRRLPGAERSGADPEAGLLHTVRERAGFPVAREEVLAAPAVRDVWDVLGGRDEEHDRLTARRVWLLGRTTGRVALLLSYAHAGQALDAPPVTGTALDADLAFYPGSAPLRALVAVQHGAAPAAPPSGVTPERALAEVAAALAKDPWLDSWPVVLDPVTPMPPATSAGTPARNGRWLLAGPSGGLPLHPSAGTPWRLVATSGGHPLTVAAEWTPRGLRPLTTWDAEGRVIVL
ncbi:SWIM zinc finger family protein [Streptosporangium sp. NPDC006007]|uniref:SWIM zinc finger family protein n=1 Tax=Streptosporangium sp. NPDC006007 TaxID=3154575 RepID=UPI00339FAFEE